MTEQAKDWYFNTVKEIPEQGKKSRIEDRMGPYASREDAIKAWKIVQERNKKWEDDDKKWNRDWGRKSQPNEENPSAQRGPIED